MKAVIQSSYGDTSCLSLKTIDIPKPNDDDILIKVKTACINRTDIAYLRGEPFIFRFFIGLLKPTKEIGGTQFSGEVVEVGKNVENFKKGDRVFGFNDEGICAYAEHTLVQKDAAIEIIPDNVSFDDAAATIEGFHYSLNTITKVGVQKGQKIMLNGGTGAIGSASLQLLKDMDCEITVTCPTDYVELINSFKPHKVIDYLKEDFTKQDSDQFDFIIDAVGKSSFSDAKHLLKSGGIYVSTELGPWCENVTQSLYTPWFGDKKVVFPIPTDIIGSLKQAKIFLQSGKFKPVIDKHVYTLDNIVEGFQYVEKGGKIGNVLVKVDE